MQKRGNTQLDWVMSMAVFLLYLAWFFIFTRPMLEPQQRVDSLADILKENVKEELDWQMDRIPLFIYSNGSAEYSPIMVTMPFEWDDFALQSNSYFYSHDNETILLKNITSGTTTIWFISSDQSYSVPNETYDLLANSASASVSNFKVYFSDSFPESIYYHNEYKIFSFNITENNLQIPVTSSEYLIKPIFGKYNAVTQNFNYTSYVFAENPRLYTEISLNTLPIGQEIILQLNITNYSNYYSDNLYYGTFSGCSNVTADFFDVYSDNGLLFDFSEDVLFSFCSTNNSYIELNITMALSDDINFNIIAHDGNYLDAEAQNYTYKWGSLDSVSGTSLEKINAFTSIDYETMKSRFGYPQSREFQIVIENSTSELMNYGESTSAIFDDVFVHKEDMWLVDKYGNKNRYTIRYRTW